jgi:maleylacetoacetate isomerase
VKLYSYYRSSAAYRVRIALGLKGVAFSTVPVNLVGGEQRGSYLDTNPQGLVPALELDDGTVLTQSTAIIEWLEESHPTPALLPAYPAARARIRALCQHIACDIHPLNNLRVLFYLRDEAAQDAEAVSRWYAHWVREGFCALEQAVTDFEGAFSLGDKPGMFEAFLVPQLYNANRWNVAVDDFPRIQALDTRCQQLDAFLHAHPDRQPDTPQP